MRQSITGDIRKIVLFYWPDYARLCAMRFYDADSKMVYESAYKDPFINSGYRLHEILLQEGEKIVGF